MEVLNLPNREWSVSPYFTRFAIWVIALIIAFLIPIEVAGLCTPQQFAQTVNKAGKFKDALLGGIAIAILCGSNLFDGVLRHPGQADRVVWYASGTLTLGLIIILPFMLLAVGSTGDGVVSDLTVENWWGCIWAVICFGALSELLIAAEQVRVKKEKHDQKVLSNLLRTVRKQ
jgi:hypothetical protein